MKRLVVVATVVTVALLGLGAVYAQEKAAVIEKGKKVSFEYTLTVDGKMFDSSKERGPVEYVQGDDAILPALAKALEGMRLGEEKDIVLPPEQAYGMPDSAAIKEVPNTVLSPDIKPEVGMMLKGQDAQGRASTAKIVEIKKETLVLDLNHPLAGKTLTFHVKVLTVK